MATDDQIRLITRAREILTSLQCQIRTNTGRRNFGRLMKILGELESERAHAPPETRNLVFRLLISAAELLKSLINN